MQPLILASTSPFRQQILQKLRLPFIAVAPDTDEHPLQNETASELVQRLSLNKAHSLINKYSNHLIIGSDQVCVLDGQITGKPLNFDNAFLQLSAASNKKIIFYTGLALLNSHTHQSTVLYETFNVYFRLLTVEEITNYLHKEQPYNCAGSFKCEGLGISLFDRLEGADFNTLVGLPLIALNKLLIKQGINALTAK